MHVMSFCATCRSVTLHAASAPSQSLVSCFMGHRFSLKSAFRVTYGGRRRATIECVLRPQRAKKPGTTMRRPTLGVSRGAEHMASKRVGKVMSGAKPHRAIASASPLKRAIRHAMTIRRRGSECGGETTDSVLTS